MKAIWRKSEMLGIPKKIGHIWIGPKPPPTEWMNTWKEKHSKWEYTLYGNEYLAGTNFRTRKQINEYFDRQEYAGVADLMRYEILYEHGGLLVGADSICYHNTEELFGRKCAYTVYENEFVRGKLVSPILACEPKNKFVGELINRLETVSTDELNEPWITTGNLFVAQMIEELQPDVIIFPSHTLIPVHYTSLFYQGVEKIYAKQMFGSTRSAYDVEIEKKDRNYSSFKEYISYRIDKRKRREKERALRVRKAHSEEYKKRIISEAFQKNQFSDL